MCGIAGIISSDTSLVNSQSLKKMADALAHRGPDGEGFWISPRGNTGFAHRRLSIIDLSENASQPMHYLGRYTIVYNGEIYNYLELRKELSKAGYTFHSKSDTEVILAAYDCYQSRCLQYFDGMFSFAIWDEKYNRLFAARDRFGEKPFYYYARDNMFAFGSEMKALWSIGADRTMDEKMLLNYLSIGQVQNPSDKSQTFFKHITSLPPAHYLEFDQANDEYTVVSYWDIDKQLTFSYSEEKAVFKLNELMTTSVHRRLRSDVLLGSSLSGGLDSSSIAWYIRNELIKNNQPTTFQTFSAVFPGFEKDESAYINEINSHFGLLSHTVSPDANDLINDFEKLVYHQEEPFPSSSIYAQYRVFELAAKNKTRVLLDGQGADEVFAGYKKYYHWYIQEFVSHHRFLRARNEFLATKRNDIAVKWGIKNVIASFLPSHAAMALEKREFNLIKHNDEIDRDLMRSLKGREWEGIYKPIVTKLNDVLYFNTMQMGLEELLRYCDRNSMAHGVEVRLPFLNAELVQFVFTLNSTFKIRNGYSKWILRTMMNDRLPESINWRTDKIGYEPPQKLWMKSSQLQDYLIEAKKKLVANKILRPTVLSQPARPADAHEQQNLDWRYLCISQLLN